MNKKNMQIAVVLLVVVIAVIVVFGFFGIGGFSFFGSAQPAQNPEQALLSQIQANGGVTQLVVDDLTPGTGPAVQAGDTVTVNYTGVLPNGTVFDSSDSHGAPFSFTVGAGNVIQGWEQGLVGMKAGGERLLAVPPSLGYGPNAYGPIPGNSTLIFDIQLLKIASPNATSTSAAPMIPASTTPAQ